ncbi:MAG TPA: PIN domain-containing protein [archaeon]|nr:PIN domain-containing protein [archaeon]
MIIDSSIIVSAYNGVDQNHETGLKIIDDVEKGKYGKEIIVSNFIFDETMTAIFAKTKNKEFAIKVGNNLLGSCIMLNVDKIVFSKSFEMFSSKNKLSFTDCTIVVMANEYGIDHIATFDKEIKKYFRNCVDS